MYSPIVIFSYNRLENLKKMIDSLRRCRNVEKHDCYIFSDAFDYKKQNDYENVKEVRDYLIYIREEGIFNNTELVFFDKHLGCEKAVINGISRVINEYGQIIDIEDDLLLCENFLDYMDEALNYYRDDNRIGSVTGFVFPLDGLNECKSQMFIAKRFCSWGFGTWENRWNAVDWDVTDYEEFKRNRQIQDSFSEYGYDLPDMLINQVETCLDTWDVQLCYSFFKRNMMTVYPTSNLVFNIGFNGTHMVNTIINQAEIDLSAKGYSFDSVDYNERLNHSLRTLSMDKEEYNNHNSVITNKYWRYYRMLSRWMKYRKQGISISKSLKDNNITSIVIYGAGELADHLLEDLSDSNIHVKGMIDRNVDSPFSGIKVFSPDEIWPEVDAIIVTPVCEYRPIKSFIESRTRSEVISLERLILV